MVMNDASLDELLAYETAEAEVAAQAPAPAEAAEPPPPTTNKAGRCSQLCVPDAWAIPLECLMPDDSAFCGSGGELGRQRAELAAWMAATELTSDNALSLLEDGSFVPRPRKKKVGEDGAGPRWMWPLVNRGMLHKTRAKQGEARSMAFLAQQQRLTADAVRKLNAWLVSSPLSCCFVLCWLLNSCCVLLLYFVTTTHSGRLILAAAHQKKCLEIWKLAQRLHAARRVFERTYDHVLVCGFHGKGHGGGQAAPRREAAAAACQSQTMRNLDVRSCIVRSRS